jgi:ABC-2 type transport system permease protein
MVATLLRLRFQVLGNSLRRSTWQLVAVIIGGIYGLGVLLGAVAGLIALGFASIEIASTAIVLAGSALVLGWIIVPLLTSGIDQTLDPARLVQFPMRMRTLLVGLALAGVLGVAGIVTSIAALATVATWLRDPLAAVAAVVCAAIGVFTCVVGSRMMAALSTSLQSRRRFRELSGVLVLIPLVLLGPIILGVTRGIASSADALPSVAQGLGWTPLGAAWAVPGDLASGDYLPALLKLLIALATLALLTVVWRASLAVALISPKASGGGRQVAKGKRGVFDVLPATPVGAIAARALIYWRRDPRYARQLIVVPLFPALLFFYSSIGGSHSLGLFTASGPIVAFLLPLGLYADISYDGTAFATHLIDGVRGRADRLGRVIAAGLIGVPLVLIVTFATITIADAWNLAPALLGLTIGALLSGYGLISVTSARIIVPVPAAGDNPFKSAPGAGITTAASSFATWGILIVLVIPELVLGVVGIIIGSALLGWITLVVGVLLGAALLVIGVRSGGALLDRTGPDLLVRLKSLRGA